MHPDGIYWNPTTGVYDFYSGGKVQWSTPPAAPTPTTPVPDNRPADSVAPPVMAAPTTPPINLGTGSMPLRQDDSHANTPILGSQGNLFSPTNDQNLQDIYYDTPGNWGDAWGQVVGKLGGVVGSNYYKFLQGYSGTAKTSYQNAQQASSGQGHTIDYLNVNAPGYTDIFHSLTASQRGENPSMYTAGRSLY